MADIWIWREAGKVLRVNCDLITRCEFSYRDMGKHEGIPEWAAVYADCVDSTHPGAVPFVYARFDGGADFWEAGAKALGLARHLGILPEDVPSETVFRER